MGILAPNNIMLEGFGWYSGWGVAYSHSANTFMKGSFSLKLGGGGRYCAISEGFF